MVKDICVASMRWHTHEAYVLSASSALLHCSPQAITALQTAFRIEFQ